jgi:hypothetical protein
MEEWWTRGELSDESSWKCTDVNNVKGDIHCSLRARMVRQACLV